MKAIKIIQRYIEVKLKFIEQDNKKARFELSENNISLSRTHQRLADEQVKSVKEYQEAIEELKELIKEKAQ